MPDHVLKNCNIKFFNENCFITFQVENGIKYLQLNK